MMLSQPYTEDNLSVTIDRSPRLPRRNMGRAAPNCKPPSLSSGPEDQEWNLRRHTSAISLSQLVHAATPKRGKELDTGSNDPMSHQARRNATFARSKSQSVSCMKNVNAVGSRSLLSPLRDLSERKVIRSPNSNYSWSSKRVSNQGLSCGMVQKPQSNFAWPNQLKQADAGLKKCIQDGGIPGSIEIVSCCEASTSEKQLSPAPSDGLIRRDGDNSTPSDTSSLGWSEDDFVLPLGPKNATRTLRCQASSAPYSSVTSTEEMILQKTMNEAMVSLSGSRRNASTSPSRGYRTPRRTPRMTQSFDLDQSKQRPDDSKRTVSTTVSTGSASEISAAQPSFLQASNAPWICLCGEDNDNEFNFCGMCARPEKWACTECHFERNKCRQIYCGKCGSKRALAAKMCVQNQAA